MTLVASYSVDDWPVAIGDIMVSNRPPKGNLRTFNIPTQNDVNEIALPATGRIVSGLVQKLTLLNNKLVVAWAGSPLCAGGIFKEIREAGENANFDDLCRVINEWRNEKGLDLYLTVLGILEQSGATTVSCQFDWDSSLGWESRKESIEHYGDCYVGGSGAEVLCDLLQKGEFVFPSQAPALERAIVLSLAHMVRLVGDQLRTGSGVKQLFGGGFEVATLLDNQIQKIGDITFHFWSATKNAENELQVTFRFALKISYFEDYLVLRRFQIAGPGPTATVTDEVYVVRPVYRYVTKPEEERIRSQISIPEMTSRFNAYYVHFPDKLAGNKTYTGVHKASSNPGESSLRYLDEGDGILKIEIDKQVFERIAAAYDK